MPLDVTCATVTDVQVPQCALVPRAAGAVPRKTTGWLSGHKAAGAELGVFATWRLSGVEWAAGPMQELFTDDGVLFTFSRDFSPSVSVSDSSWSLSSSSSSSSDPSVSDSELLSDSVEKQAWQKAHYDSIINGKHISVLTPAKSFVLLNMLFWLIFNSDLLSICRWL